MEHEIHGTLLSTLEKLKSKLLKIRIDHDKKQNIYQINIETDDTSLLIGHHGETIAALQHILRLLLWKKYPNEQFDITLDIDGYKKRQEENAIKIANRKVEMVRKLSTPQSLPAMSAYLRKVIHLHLAQEKYNDIRTESLGNGESRHIMIKPQPTI